MNDFPPTLSHAAHSTRREARGTARFLLALALFATAYYAFNYWRSYDARTAFAADFGMFYEIGQKLAPPWPTAAAIYDLTQARDYAAGRPVDYIPYLYLPHFLPVLAPLRGAEAPMAAYGWWMGAQLVLYGFAMRFVRPPGLGPAVGAWERGTGLSFAALMLAVAAPHLLHLIVAGHPSIVAALLVYVGYAWLRARPMAAGILFALACYKPQMALMLPVLLLAGRHGRALAVFVGTLALLLAGATWMFGLEFWPHYLALLHGHGEIMRTVPKAVQNQALSIYAACVMLGAPAWLAALGQGIGALGLLTALARAAHRHRRTPEDQRLGMTLLALLVLAPFLTSPYVMLWDSVMLVPALAMLLLAEVTGPPRLSRRLAIILGLFLPLLMLTVQAKRLPVACPILLWMAVEAYLLSRPIAPNPSAQ